MLLLLLLPTLTKLAAADLPLLLPITLLQTSRGGRWTPGKGHHCPGKEVVVVHE